MRWVRTSTRYGGSWRAAWLSATTPRPWHCTTCAPPCVTGWGGEARSDTGRATLARRRVDHRAPAVLAPVTAVGLLTRRWRAVPVAVVSVTHSALALWRALPDAPRPDASSIRLSRSPAGRSGRSPRCFSGLVADRPHWRARQQARPQGPRHGAGRGSRRVPPQAARHPLTYRAGQTSTRRPRMRAGGPLDRRRASWKYTLPADPLVATTQDWSRWCRLSAALGCAPARSPYPR
jgi:hypothetical protein